MNADNIIRPTMIKIYATFSGLLYFFKTKFLEIYQSQDFCSSSEAEYLKQLKQNGFCVIQKEKFRLAAERIKDKYFETEFADFSESVDLFETLDTPVNRIGNYSRKVSFKPEEISSVVFDETVTRVLKSYVPNSRYREQPLLELYRFENPGEATRDIGPYAVSMHSDFYRQVNVMLLLTDISEADTCTEYAVGSNSRNVFMQGNNISYPHSNKIIEEGKYVIKQITGKAGDLVLMDTTGIHRVRVASDSCRALMVAVANPGFPFLGYLEEVSDIESSLIRRRSRH